MIPYGPKLTSGTHLLSGTYLIQGTLRTHLTQSPLLFPPHPKCSPTSTYSYSPSLRPPHPECLLTGTHLQSASCIWLSFPGSFTVYELLSLLGFYLSLSSLFLRFSQGLVNHAQAKTIGLRELCHPERTYFALFLQQTPRGTQSLKHLTAPGPWASGLASHAGALPGPLETFSL